MSLPILTRNLLRDIYEFAERGATLEEAIKEFLPDVSMFENKVMVEFEFERKRYTWRSVELMDLNEYLRAVKFIESKGPGFELFQILDTETGDKFTATWSKLNKNIVDEPYEIAKVLANANTRNPVFRAIQDMMLKEKQ